MRCAICNNHIEKPVIDPRDGRIWPCSECQEAIDDALSDWDEAPDVQVATSGRYDEIEQAARAVLCEWDDVNIGGVELNVADHNGRIERLRDALAAPATPGREHIAALAEARAQGAAEAVP